MDVNITNDDESTSCGQVLKKSKAEMTDAESNTINSGKLFISFLNHNIQYFNRKGKDMLVIKKGNCPRFHE